VHAQVVSMEMLPINVAESMRIYQDRVLPAARDQEGFKGAWMLTDPETGEGLSISGMECRGRYARKRGERLLPQEA
jgi:hypothetical protein